MSGMKTVTPERLCQNRFSRSEADMNGGVKVMGEHVGCGNYCSRVIGADTR